MEDSWPWNPAPEKLLVTGVDGVVGANLALSLADQFEVLGLFQDRPVSLPGVSTASWDPADPAEWTALVHEERPRWILHCGPAASGSWDVPEPCPDPEAEARTVARLAQVAQEMEGRLTMISSDAVFAGPRMFHDEDAPAGSRQPFARAVRRAEEALEGTGALVVRTHAYGWSPAGTPPGFAERTWQTLIEGRRAPRDTDRHATPIPATELAEFLRMAYRRGLKGRCHVAGAERTTAYRFALEMAAAFGLSGWEALAETRLFPHAEPNHLYETSLATRLARRELGRAMPMLREGLDRFAEQAANGYRARLQCGVRRAAVAAEAA